MRRLGMLLLLLCAAGIGARAAEPPAKKFVVFFQSWSAAIDDPAQTVISQAAASVTAQPGGVVHVRGYASTLGGRQANILLADLRAQVVADQLVANGVDPRSVLQRGHGPVPFALTAQEGRRVEISIGPH